QSGVIYIMNQDGSNPHPLSSPLRYVNHLSWSPDGASLYFDYDSNGDGWQDLGYMTIDNARLYTIATANPETDLLASGWYPYPYTPGNGVSTEVVASQVNYILYQGQWYIESMSAHMRYIGSAYPDMALARKFDYPLYPHLRPRDPYAPFSVINPLPKYSRIPFIPFSVYTYDVGKSGLRTVDAEYMLGTSGSWNSLQPVFPFFDPTSALLGSGTVFVDTAGQTLSMRAGSSDNAGNTEVPPDVPDASTMLYQTLVSGTVRDIRDTPVSEARLSISPAPAGMEIGDGWYHAYLPDAGEYAVTVGAQGYLSASMKMASPVDVQQDGVIHPADNLIQGGDFSTTTLNSAWVVSGTATIHLDMRYTGSASLHLGATCQNAACLFGQGKEISYTVGSIVDYAFDSDQNLHLITADGVYFMRSLDGQWSRADVWSTYSAVGVAMDTGPGNVVYLVRGGFSPVLYIHDPATSAWYSETLPSGVPAGGYDLVVDDVSGDVYIRAEQTLVHRDPAGTWTNMGAVDGNSLGLVSAHDGGVDIVALSDVAKSLSIKHVRADGTSTTLAEYHFPQQMNLYGWIDAVQSSSGRVHVFLDVMDALHMLYLSWSPGEGWSTPVIHARSSMMPLQGDEVVFLPRGSQFSDVSLLFYDPGDATFQQWNISKVCAFCSEYNLFVFPDKTVFALYRDWYSFHELR
ncbi:MAG: carboxypeptidase regulatory-like domain-containing protein, partial [Anaerolineae bacterium]